MGLKLHEGQPYHLVRSRDGADGRHRTDFELTCGKCGCAEKIHARPQSAPEQVFMSFRRKGWHVAERNAKHCVCPQCVTSGRNKPATTARPLFKPVTAPAAAPSQPPCESHIMTQKEDRDQLATNTVNGPDVRAATMKEARDIFALLDEVFDEDRGAYRPGHDDKSVSAKLDIPWATVKRTREEAGLMIKQDPEIVALRGEIQAAVELITHLQRRLATLEQRKVA